MPHPGLENTIVAEILKTKGDDDVWAVFRCRINNTVYDAVKQITQNNIGALIVVKPGDQKLVAGIITKRNYRRYIIVQGRTSKATIVGDIMTDEEKLITVSGTNILQAMQLMTAKHIRHVSVSYQKVVRMISIMNVVRCCRKKVLGVVRRH